MKGCAGYLLSVCFSGLLSLTLLTHCGYEDNNAQDKGDTQDRDEATDHATPSSPSSTSPPTPERTVRPEHRFTPAQITAGLPFSFELAWQGRPYLLSLDNCGAGVLLLQGMWPEVRDVTNHIRGEDGAQLHSLVITNDRGDPTIPAGCRLKATVARGTDDEQSVYIVPDLKAGALTVSNASIGTNTVALTAEGMPHTDTSGLAIAKKTTFIADGEAYSRYTLVAISHPFNNAVVDGRVESGVTLYAPPPGIALPTDVVTAFEVGDYLISVANFRLNLLALSIDFVHVSTITATKR